MGESTFGSLPVALSWSFGPQSPSAMVLLYALALLLPAVTGYIPRRVHSLCYLAGGVFPGPIIRGKKGDTFSINVTDHLEDTSMDLATSIHWHGIFQKGTNYVDGVASVTQCPLVPGESFLYKFNVFDQTGTYWYHGHFKNQYCDGLRGALIIEDPDDPQRYLYDIDDDSTVISLADWYHAFSTVPPTFQKDNASTFLLTGHNMTVIEVDGNNVMPLQIDSLQIYAAKGASNDALTGSSQSTRWQLLFGWRFTQAGIRSLPNAAGQNFSGLNNLAVLHYAGAAKANPTYDPTSDVPVSQMLLVETNLHPLTNSPVNHPFQPGNPVPGGADININLAVVQ
ncbi:Cupredoxin, partial [Lactarius quietus]